MKNRKLTRLAGLNKRIQYPSLELRHHKRLPKVVAVLVEAQNAPVHIEQDSNNTALSKVPIPGHIILVHIIVVFPLSVIKLISSLKIYCPHFLLSGQILVHLESFSA